MPGIAGGPRVIGTVMTTTMMMVQLELEDRGADRVNISKPTASDLDENSQSCARCFLNTKLISEAQG